MACLVCRYFQPTEPPEHKQQREAGQCQSNCGNKWDQHTAISYVKNHGHLEGWCRLHPEPRRCAYNHVCGDISVREHYLNHYWCLEPFGSEDNIFEWAGKTLSTILHGSPWRGSARVSELEESNAELRRQLKAARKISASRLKRLQKTKQPEPEQSPVEPFQPRLVAAE